MSAAALCGPSWVKASATAIIVSTGSTRLELVSVPSFVAIIVVLGVAAAKGIAAIADVTGAAECARGTGHRLLDSPSSPHQYSPSP